ncbi:MAG: PD-(D/E)XK nuclease family protein, partial [Firmicutes bacterium]|nr:PD-(D/E)XK nuclease family protein [Bacillota bacterium]
MDTFSFSRLEKFRTCPYAFFRHYELGIKEPPTEALALGRAVHAAIEAVIIRGIPVEEAARQAAAAADLPVDPAEVERLASAFTGTYEPDPKARLEVEREFVLELAPGVKARGYIDLLEVWPDGRVRLTDFKTDRIPYQ